MARYTAKLHLQFSKGISCNPTDWFIQHVHAAHTDLTILVVVLWLLTVAAGLQDGWPALAILAWSEQHPVPRLQLLVHPAQHA